MNRQLVDYANALSMVVFTQAIEIENQRRVIDCNTKTLLKCKDTIEALMNAAFGKVEVYETGEQL